MRFEHLVETIWVFALAITMVSDARSQSYFNRVLGTDPYNGSARATAMGKSFSLTDESSNLLLINPAGLANFTDGFELDFHYSGQSVLERRSIDIKDFFGDFLTQGEYVANRNYNFDVKGGFIWNKNIGDKINFSAASSFGPLTSFYYRYREEVRGRSNFEDGVIGNKDPLLGYHIFETDGTLNMISIGGALAERYLRNSVSIGLTVHNILESEISDIFKVDTIKVDKIYLSKIEPVSRKMKTPSAWFYSIGFRIASPKGITFSFGFNSEVSLKTKQYTTPTIIETLGLPGYTSVPEPGESIRYLPQGLNYIKPETWRIGLKYEAKDALPMVLVTEWEKVNSRVATLNDTLITLREVIAWKFGFEYIALKEIPVRAGFIFRNSPFKVIGPETVFTFGTGKVFGSLTVDIAGTYSLKEYQYPDLFPVPGEIRPDLDTITESRFNLTTSIQYRF